MKRILLLAATALSLSATEEPTAFEVSLRESRAGVTIRDFGGAHAGPGASVAWVQGDETLRARIRFDADRFGGRNGGDPVRAYGLGADGVIVVPTTSTLHPFLSIGGSVSNWSWDRALDPNADGKSKSWKFSVRAEAGVYYNSHINLHVGVLRGSIASNRLVKCPYVGVTFAF
jgi:opacity protein-like surface antigen